MIFPLLGVVALYGIYKLLPFFFRPTTAHTLPGPDHNPSWFFGFNKIEWARPDGGLHLEWVRQYGHVFSSPSFFSSYRIFTTDSRALAHVLNKPEIYEKPAAIVSILTHILGAGLVSTQGEAHRRQRKALNPAFGSAQLRALTGIMLDKANELCEVLDNTLPPTEKTSAMSPSMDIIPFLSRCTLDIIGLAGFGYNFSSLSATSAAQSELYEAFQTAMSFTTGSPLITALNFLVPGFRSLPTPSNRKMDKAMATMERIGTELIHERKILAAMDESAIEKPTLGRPKDLLSLLVRANTLASSNDRLDDKEVLAQIPTFLGAGHETTSTLLSWILLSLARNPEAQEKLRAECLSSTLPTTSRGNDPLSSEELTKLDKLEWLDAIVRETLRVHSPVSLMGRVACADDEIPLSRPYVDRSGVTRDTISMKKGDNVMLPLSLVNRTESIWGPDAEQWRPERWMQALPEEATKVPGVWSNILSFSAGPHGCIGYKFSLYEAKIILHALICRYVFHLSDGPEEVVPLAGLVVRPTVKGQEQEGARLMLRLSRVEV